jgi:hypothetical protein
MGCYYLVFCHKGAEAEEAVLDLKLLLQLLSKHTVVQRCVV